jgi:hypothetical protein
VSGRGIIASKQKCQEATNILFGSNTGILTTSVATQPPGCSRNANGYTVFNNNTNATGKCDSHSQTGVSDYCICRTGLQFLHAIVACEKCPAGWKGIQEGVVLKCEKCATGEYQAKSGQAFCLPCVPGRYQHQYGSPNCQLCETGKHTAVEGQNVACSKCSEGMYQNENGTATCKNCISGRYGSKLAATAMNECLKCPAGKYSSAKGATSVNDCVDCPPGRYGETLGAVSRNTTCKYCGKNTYQADGGSSKCFECPHGRSSNENSKECSSCSAGKAKIRQTVSKNFLLCGKKFCKQPTLEFECHTCPIGKISKAGDAVCHACQPGSYFAEIGITATCLPCPAGKWQNEKESKSCKDCVPGMFRNVESEGLLCSQCPTGYSQPKAGSTFCLITVFPIQDSSAPEKVIFQVKSNSLVDVTWNSPSKIGDESILREKLVSYEIQVSTSRDFITNGKHNETHVVIMKNIRLENKQTMRLALDGLATSNGAKFRSIWLLVVYVRIRIYSHGNQVGGPWSISPDPWVVASDCREESQFLNNSHASPSKWYCVDCFLGQKCNTDSTLRNPEVSKGYWRSSPTSSDFNRYKHYRCPNPSACSGGKNVTSRCATGYNSENGPLCAVCEKGYVLRNSYCLKCPFTNSSSNNVDSTAPTTELIGMYMSVLVITFFALTMVFYFADRKRTTIRIETRPAENILNSPGNSTINTDDLQLTTIHSSKQFCGNKHLFLIAIDDYPSPADSKSNQYQTLEGCVADAEAMEQQLAQQHGFVVYQETRLFNERATIKAIEQGFNFLRDKVEKRDQVIVFIAGHGEKKTGFVCYDEKQEDRILYKQFHELYLSKLKSEHVLLVIDTCHADTIRQQGLVETRLKVTNRHEIEPAKHVIAAVTGDEVALEYFVKKKKRGLFTKFFLDAINSKSVDPEMVAFRPRATKVTASAVHSYILPKIFEESDLRGCDQNPQFGTYVEDSQATGQFVFYRDKPALETPVSVHIERNKNALVHSNSHGASSHGASKYLAIAAADLGKFRYQRLVDVLIAAPTKNKALSLDVLCAQLNIDEEDMHLVLEKHRHVLEYHDEGVSLVSMSYDWLRHHPRPNAIPRDSDDSIKTWYDDDVTNEENRGQIKHLGANAQSGHTALFAYCVAHQDTPYSSQWLRHHQKQRKRLHKMPLELVNINVGHIMPKLKILVGFVQVLSYLPVVFEVPWPSAFKEWIAWMQLFSLDIFEPLLAMSCNLRGGFLPLFSMHMGLIPLLSIVAIVADRLVRCIRGREKHQNLHLFRALDLIMFFTYAGMCSRIFVLFRCIRVDDVWYLVADMRVQCFEKSWNNSMALAVVCMLILMFGIPFTYLFTMCNNREYLYDRDSFHDNKFSEELAQHRWIKNVLGSVYDPYRKGFYYSDQVETLRRVLLTGGLVLLGEDSVTRIFLGVLISMIWLLFVAGFHPYASNWDNTLSIILSAQIVVTLVSGMALNMYSISTKEANNDGFQEVAFSFLLITANLLCIAAGFVAIFGCIPAVQKHCFGCCRQCVNKPQEEDLVESDFVGNVNTTKVLPLKNNCTNESSAPSKVSIAKTSAVTTTSSILTAPPQQHAIHEERKVHFIQGKYYLLTESAAQKLLRKTNHDSQAIYDDFGSRGARPTLVLQKAKDISETNNETKTAANTLPAETILNRVKNCKVIFTFGSKYGGLDLARKLRSKLRSSRDDGGLGWGEKDCTAYIDCEDNKNSEGSYNVCSNCFTKLQRENICPTRKGSYKNEYKYRGNIEVDELEKFIAEVDRFEKQITFKRVATVDNTNLNDNEFDKSYQKIYRDYWQQRASTVQQHFNSKTTTTCTPWHGEIPDETPKKKSLEQTVKSCIYGGTQLREEIMQCRNDHWAEYYYGAMTVCHTVVLMYDDAWKESRFCQSEWKLVLKNKELAEFDFNLIIVYDKNNYQGMPESIIKGKILEDLKWNDTTDCSRDDGEQDEGRIRVSFFGAQYGIIGS